MRMSENGIEMLKRFEGFSASSYKDGNGYSIGYGHHGAQPGQEISKEMAEELLVKDLAHFEKGVLSLLARPVTQEQFDALVSYAYNCGIYALKETKMLDHINNGDDDSAIAEWTKGWENDLEGIRKRRETEANLYKKGTIKTKEG
jgi:lysozyme